MTSFSVVEAFHVFENCLTQKSTTIFNRQTPLPIKNDTSVNEITAKVIHSYFRVRHLNKKRHPDRSDALLQINPYTIIITRLNRNILSLF
jgi:hypothetical protein